MTPAALTPLDGDMFRELLAEIRHVRTQIDNVDAKLDSHVSEQGRDFDGVKADISQIREEVITLRTKLGLIAGVAAMLAAGVVQGVATVFF